MATQELCQGQPCVPGRSPSCSSAFSLCSPGKRPHTYSCPSPEASPSSDGSWFLVLAVSAPGNPGGCSMPGLCPSPVSRGSWAHARLRLRSGPSAGLPVLYFSRPRGASCRYRQVAFPGPCLLTPLPCPSASRPSPGLALATIKPDCLFSAASQLPVWSRFAPGTLLTESRALFSHLLPRGLGLPGGPWGAAAVSGCWSGRDCGSRSIPAE